jgi:hypothetical protein
MRLRCFISASYTCRRPAMISYAPNARDRPLGVRNCTNGVSFQAPPTPTWASTRSSPTRSRSAERFRGAVLGVPRAHDSIRPVRAICARWTAAALQAAAVSGTRVHSAPATRAVRLVGPHPLLLGPDPSRNRCLGGWVRLLPPHTAPRRSQHGGGAPRAPEAGPPTVVGDGMIDRETCQQKGC